MAALVGVGVVVAHRRCGGGELGIKKRRTVERVRDDVDYQGDGFVIQSILVGRDEVVTCVWSVTASAACVENECV